MVAWGINFGKNFASWKNLPRIKTRMQIIDVESKLCYDTGYERSIQNHANQTLCELPELYLSQAGAGAAAQGQSVTHFDNVHLSGAEQPALRFFLPKHGAGLAGDRLSRSGNEPLIRV